MAKNVYIGIANLSKRVPTIYIGVANFFKIKTKPLAKNPQHLEGFLN